MATNINTQLDGLMTINGKDAWTTWGVFLTEDSPAGMDNIKQILASATTKEQTGVIIDNEDGKRYPQKLSLMKQERDITLHVAQYADTVGDWLSKYESLITELKTGYDTEHTGWTLLTFPTLGIELTVFLQAVTSLTPITCLWKTGRQAAKYKIKFKDPTPKW